MSRAKIKTLLTAIVAYMALAVGTNLLAAGHVVAACDPLPSDKGQSKNALDVGDAGQYTLWVRLWAPTADSNSVAVQVDGQCPIVVSASPQAGFQWVNYGTGQIGQTLHYTLSAGQHTVVVAGRSAGAGADRAMFLSDPTCVPFGTGDNCLAATSETNTPAAGATKAGTVRQTFAGIPKWWAVGGCAVAMAAAVGVAVWQFASHARVMAAGASHAERGIVVGGAWHAEARLATKLWHFARHHPFVVGACGVVFIASLIVGIVAAETHRSLLEVESGTLSGGATVVQDATASGGKYVVFVPNAQASAAAAAAKSAGSGAAKSGTGGSSSGGTSSSSGSSPSSGGSSSSPSSTGNSTCPLPKYPSPSCTGVPAGTSLTTINGDYEANVANATIDGKHITGNLYILANNITVKNSQVDGTIYNDGTYDTNGIIGGSFTVTDTTIGTAGTCIGQPAINDSNYTATRVLSHGHDDGFRVGPPGNVKIYDSYVVNCYLPPSQAPPDGSHSDGVQAVCGGTTCSGVLVQHSTFDGTKVPTTNMLNLTDPSLAAVTATDNLLLGGGYTIDAWWHSGAKWLFTNNRIVNNSWAYGPVTAENTCANQTWSGNTLVTADSNYNVTSTVAAQPCVE